MSVLALTIHVQTLNNTGGATAHWILHTYTFPKTPCPAKRVASGGMIRGMFRRYVSGVCFGVCFALPCWNHGYDSWYDLGAWFGVWFAEMQHACDHKFCIRHFWKHSKIYIYIHMYIPYTLPHYELKGKEFKKKQNQINKFLEKGGFFSISLPPIIFFWDLPPFLKNLNSSISRYSDFPPAAVWLSVVSPHPAGWGPANLQTPPLRNVARSHLHAWTRGNPGNPRYGICVTDRYIASAKCGKTTDLNLKKISNISKAF